MKSDNKKNTKENSLFSTQNIALMALCVALIAVCSWISIPINTVPVTLQTFGVLVVVGILGLQRGVVSVIAYILLGIIGLPVFSGFSGGISKFTPNSETGATGGYILGFILLAVVMGSLMEWIKKVKDKEKYNLLFILSMILGDIVCFAFGTAWFVKFNPWGMGISASVTACVIPFIIPDVVKIILAFTVINRIKKLKLFK